MAEIRTLLAEQGSPVEVLVFLALAVALFLGVAALLYVLIMVVLRPGLPREVPLRRILLPSGEQLRENLGDYALAVASSLLLSLTLLAKHDLVRQIASYDLRPEDATVVAGLFDFGLPAPLVERLGEATLAEIVRPALDAGRVEEASLLVQTVIGQLPEPWLTPRNLVVACCVLAGLYLAWLARRRVKALRQRPDSPPAYAATFRSLLTLALCVGLLLASALPLAEGGERLLAASALGAIAHGGGETAVESPIARDIRAELERQRQRASALYCPSCGAPTRSIWEVVEEGSVGTDELTARLRELDAAGAAADAALETELATLRALVEEERGRLAALTSTSAVLEERLVALASAAEAGESRLAALDAVARDAADCCRLREREIAELGRRQEAESGRLGGRLDDLERRLAGVQTALDGREEQRRRELRELLARLERAQAEALAGLAARLAALDERVSGLGECCGGQGEVPVIDRVRLLEEMVLPQRREPVQ